MMIHTFLWGWQAEFVLRKHRRALVKSFEGIVDRATDRLVRAVENSKAQRNCHGDWSYIPLPTDICVQRFPQAKYNNAL